jgi:hypothetical protein
VAVLFWASFTAGEVGFLTWQYVGAVQRGHFLLIVLCGMSYLTRHLKVLLIEQMKLLISVCSSYLL